VALQSLGGIVSAELVDVAIDEMGGYGISATSESSLRSSPSIQRVIVRRCDAALFAQSSSPQGLKVTARDSVFAGSITVGVQLDNAVDLVLERCRSEHNGIGGLRTFAPQLGLLQSVVARDCLFSRNGGFGVASNTVGSLHGSVSFDLSRCTIVDNMDNGVLLAGQNPPVGIAIHESILTDNGVDVFVSGNNAGLVLANDSLIGDGFAAGSNGCFSADPLFRDQVHGDYRLRFDSPCIDRGSPNAGVALDLARKPRTLDGDLDLSKRTDLGAYELAPIDGPATVSIGSALALEVWGATGASSRVFWSRQPLLNSPQPTPFGPLYLQLPRRFQDTSTLGSEPVLVSRLVPNSPQLVGQTFAFQARTQSGDAPAGEAYTNALSITIVP